MARREFLSLAAAHGRRETLRRVGAVKSAVTQGVAQQRVGEDELLRLEPEGVDHLCHGWGREARHLLRPQLPQQQHRLDRVEQGGRLADPTRRGGSVLQQHKQLFLPLLVPVQHALAHGVRGISPGKGCLSQRVLRGVPLQLLVRGVPARAAGRLLLRQRRPTDGRSRDGCWRRHWCSLRRWHRWLQRPPQRRRRHWWPLRQRRPLVGMVLLRTERAGLGLEKLGCGGLHGGRWPGDGSAVDLAGAGGLDRLQGGRWT